MFRDRLMKAIEEKGVSQYQIAKDTKITEATLSNYCSGKGKPSPSIVMQLATYLEVDFDWLFNGLGKATTAFEPQNQYTVLGKKKFNDQHSSVIISHLEKQIHEKDIIINKLTSIIEEKIEVLINRQTNND